MLVSTELANTRSEARTDHSKRRPFEILHKTVRNFTNTTEQPSVAGLCYNSRYLNLYQQGGLDQCLYFHHAGSRLDIPEKFAVGPAYFFPS